MNVVTAIKNGDHFVFQQVFNQYHEKLYFFILEKTRSEYLSEEVVQITFIKLWRYRQSLNENFTISTQIFRIATTSLIDLKRKQYNNDVMMKELFSQQDSEISNTSTANKIDEKELREKITGIIYNMPAVQRRVFEMSKLEGLSYKEIAEALSISVKTVEVHISRALKRIREHLPLIILYFICR